jgi:hypothetical protein
MLDAIGPRAAAEAANVEPIAVVQGADSRDIQALFNVFVAGLPAGVRVAGVVEEHLAEPGHVVCDPILRNLRNGRRHPLFQDLGPGSTSCGLDGGSVVAVCEEVLRDIAAGCDLVVLSKFARLEAERTGLIGAFASAIAARKPILTSVSPRYDETWSRFAAPLFVMLPPDLAAIERWWREVSTPGPDPR